MAAVHIGKSEQVIRAQTCLHVLERHVEQALALGEGMSEIGKHLPRGRPDVEFPRGDAERVHQREGIGLGRIARREARHRKGENIAARLAKTIHRLSGDDQGVGRIEPAGYADDEL